MSGRSFRYLLGTAAALTAVAVSASAQQPTTRDTTRADTSRAAVRAGARATDSTRLRTRTSRGIRVTKERGGMMATDTMSMRRDTTTMTPAPAPTPMPAPDTTRRDTTMTPMPAPAPAPDTTRRDTTTVTAVPTPMPTTTEPTTSPVMRGRFGNGFYIGIDGGGSLPQGYFNDWYKSGWSVGIPFGWQRQDVPIGVRADIDYTRMSGRDFAVSNFLTGSTADPQIWSGQLDLKLNLPLNRGSTWRPALYLLGGGGVHYFKNFSSSFNSVAGTGTGTTFQTGIDESKSQTKFGLNGGVGLSFGLGQADLFVESRYVSAFTANNNTNWVPITVGITFF
jgi:hypothetical protein